MSWSFNPFTGNLDLVGSGGGAVVFEGEVETFDDLPAAVGDPAVGASFLVRSSTGVWLVNRRQAGIWIRRNNTGVRATDWEYGGDYPVNSVNGQTGNVVLSASDVGAAPATGISPSAITGTAVVDSDARLSDSRTPTAHAASHAAGTKAEYNDQVAGMNDVVLLRANNLGIAGNSITLTFDGVDDIDTALAAWNSANPSNQATLIDGDGSQVPDNGEEIALSGATGDDPLFDQNLNTTDKPTFDGLVVGQEIGGYVQGGLHRAQFVATGSQTPLTIIGGSGSVEFFKNANAAPSHAAAFGFAVPGNAAGNNLVFSDQNGGWSAIFEAPKNAPLDIKTGGVKFADATDNTKKVELSAASVGAGQTRVVTFPNKNITLDDAGDARTPASHTHGNLTNDGKVGSDAGRVLVTTTAGAISTLALGTAGQVLTVNSGANGVEFAAASGGVSAVGASTADVFSVSGSDLVADDGGTIDSSDPFIKWDDAAGKLVYANPLSRPSGAMYVGLAPSTTALGSNAINVQATRTNAADVASGSASICIGTGGIRASGNESIAMGVGGFVTGLRAVGIGYAPSATGTSSICITGLLDSASGVNSVGINGIATLRAQFATRPFSAIYWSGQTTNNTATILNLDATATNRFTIAANTALIADIFLIARSSDNTKFLSARRSVAIYRDNANVTALIGDVQTLGNDQSIGSPTWSIALTADDTNEALQLQVTGATGETVNWRATAFYRVV